MPRRVCRRFLLAPLLLLDAVPTAMPRAGTSGRRECGKERPEAELGQGGSRHLGVLMATGLREHFPWRLCPTCRPGPGHVPGGCRGVSLGLFSETLCRERRLELQPWAGMGRKEGDTDPHGAGSGRSRNHPDLLQKISPARAAGEAELVAGG